MGINNSSLSSGWEATDREIELLAHYQMNPAQCIEDVLGVTLWPKQKEIAQALWKHRRISVRAAGDVGKSFIAACIVIWALINFPRCYIITTAPTNAQVKDILWREVRMLWKKRSGVFPIAPGISSNLKDLKIDDERLAVGFATDQPERMSGRHDERIFFIIDEATGVDDSIIRSIDNSMGGENAWMILISNPTRRRGYFYRSHMDQTFSQLFHRIHISADECAAWHERHIKKGNAPIPGLVTRQAVKEKRRLWQHEPDSVSIFLEGNFPDTDTQGLFKTKAWEEAYQRTLGPTGDKRILCDVARFGGDQTVIGYLDGPCLMQVIAYQGRDTMQTVGEIMSLLHDNPTAKVVVDDTSVGGGVTDRLKELGVDVTPFNGGRRSDRPERYANLKAEAYWSLRERVHAGVSNAEVPQIDLSRIDSSHQQKILIQQSLCNYERNSKGQIRILEPNDSPDYIEMLVLDHLFYQRFQNKDVLAEMNEFGGAPMLTAGLRNRRF